MIQNLRFVYSHPDLIILTGLFCIIIYLIFPIQKFNRTIAFRIIAACCLWWILLVFIYPPHGFNYSIYKYNASLTISGHKTFGRRNNQVGDINNAEYKDAKYLDYTAAQHLAYVMMEELNLSNLNPKLSGLGFQLWTIFNISTIILLIVFLYDYSNEDIPSEKLWPIIFISFFPVIPFYNIVSSWEDKLIFLLIPLLLLYLIKIKKYKIASFSIGVFIGYNGATVFFLPIYLIFLFQATQEKFWQNILFSLLGISLALIPYFPESLFGWANRIHRTDITKPFWYSIYLLLPSGTYSPVINTLAVMVSSSLAAVFFYFKKINLIDALIISISVVIIISPYNGVSRVIPVILLVSILTPNMNKMNWLFLGLFLFIFFTVDSGYITPVVNIKNTVLFYVPILYSFMVYVYKRLKSDNYSIIIAD